MVDMIENTLTVIKTDTQGVEHPFPVEEPLPVLAKGNQEAGLCHRPLTIVIIKILLGNQTAFQKRK